MKKLILLGILILGLSVSANEMIEDYLDIATNYVTFGKYNEAMIYLDKILQVEPSNSEVKELKNTLLRVTNPNIESYLTSTNINLKNALNAKKNGNKNLQVSILKSQPNDYWANYFLAEYFMENKDYNSAIETYKNAINIKPNYAQSYLGIAQAFIEVKDYQNAIENLNKYLTYNKNSDTAYALRALANLNLNYLIEAEDDIEKALSIESNTSYLLIQAKILYYKGNYDGAREKLLLLSRIIQTSEVYKYIGLCDYAQNDYSSALLNLDKAIILFDDDKELISTYNNIKSMLEK